ncbi:MAG: hypothetical protein ABWK01_09910 [Infirmifilum sp.]
MTDMRMKLALTPVLVALIFVVLGTAFSAPPTIPVQASTKTGNTFIFTVESLTVSGSTGTTKTVTVVVSYYGKYTLLGSSISLTTGCNATVLSDQPVLLGSWRPGTVKTATFTVDGSNASNLCPISVLITWQDSWDDATSMNTGMGGSVPISTQLNACWSEDLRVSIKPQMIYLNSVNSAVLEVKNNGAGTLEKVSLSISGQGLTLLNVTVPLIYTLEKMPSGYKISIPLQLVAQSSFPSLQVTATYVDCTGNAKTIMFTVPLYASQGQSILVVPDPSSVIAGTRSNVTLKVINMGSISVNSVQVILNLQASPIAISPATLSLDTLKPGETKSFTVKVDVPSTASTSTPVTYQVVYTAPGSGVALTQGSFTLFILQRSSLSITSIEVVPQQVEVGSNVVFALALINDGTYPVYAVNVSAQPSDGLVSSRSLYTYLGQLNPQALTSVPFSFKAVKEGTYEVKFTVTYVDAYGKRGVVERGAVVKVVPASNSNTASSPRNSYGLALLAAAITIAAVAVGYLYRRLRGKGAVN